MKNVKLVIRILLGAGMVFFGLNKFFNWMIPEVNAEMGTFMGALFSSGFLMELVAVVEIATGVMFLLNKYVPLSLIVLLPVLVIAFLSHLFLDPAGIPGAAMFLLFTILLMIWNKESYKEVLKA